MLRRSQHRRLHSYIVSFGVGGVLGSLLIFSLASAKSTYSHNSFTAEQTSTVVTPTNTANKDIWHENLPMLSPHIETPETVRGIYLSAWTAGNPEKMNAVINFISESKFINTVVIDIKDSTGIISYTGKDPLIKSYGTYSKRISDIQKVIKNLHKENIYVIGRLTAFDDPFLGKRNDDLVLKDTKGNPWFGAKGNRQWIDPSNKDYHEYLVRIAREAHELGFDEINFDYVRYPSEGKLADILTPDNNTKRQVMNTFFAYINEELRQKSKILISADVFGLTTTGVGDMGIGQVWEDIIPHVDYICPMTYPSHYAPGSFGYNNPAEYPGEIMAQAVMGAYTKTSNMDESLKKIRPWIQDFHLGAHYDTTKVRAQIRAIENYGNGSFLSWDPNNRYTESAYSEQ